MARNPMTIFTPGSLMAGPDPFLMLHREMNRLFDDALRGSIPANGDGARSTVLAPHMDVHETDKEVQIQAELPGVNENDIEVSLNEDVLTLRADKKQDRKEERGGVHLSERSYGTFRRSLRLPFPVNPDQVQAQFENGVLRVTLPKTQPQERTRRIQVRGQAGKPEANEGDAGPQADGIEGSSQTAGASQVDAQPGAAAQ